MQLHQLLLEIACFAGGEIHRDSNAGHRADAGGVEDRVRPELLQPADRVRGLVAGLGQPAVRGFGRDHRVDMVALRAGEHRLRRRGAAAVVPVLHGGLGEPALIADHPGGRIRFHVRGAPPLLLQRQQFPPGGGAVHRGERLRQRPSQTVGDVVADAGEVIDQRPGGRHERALVYPRFNVEVYRHGSPPLV
ncbi:hypothetical protein [Mycobacterium avium]|uniref:hypothetical protein n=1 Tax=Mycobacterium avium TaxID=1764 RepID=UPI001CE0B41F|nr:hypothetical protein [Mycobacterium avium]